MNKIFTQKCDKIVGECIKSLSNLSTKNDCFSCLHDYCLDNLVCLNKEQRDYCLLQLEDYVRKQDLKNLEEADKCELKSFKCLVEIRAYNEEDMREQLDSIDNYELEWFCVGGSDE
jgi:hypothetical protein